MSNDIGDWYRNIPIVTKGWFTASVVLPLAGIFDGRPGDYIFMMLFCWLSAVLLGLALNIMIIWEGIILSAVYVWCQINRDQIVTFWFGIRFKAAYLPWVLLGFNFILTGRIMQEILGIFVGHLYFFLKFKYPQDFGGRRLLETPQFLYKYFPNVRGSGGFGSVPPLRRRNIDDNANPQGHRWGGGGGRRLGD